MTPGFQPPKPDAGSETPAALRQHTREISAAVLGVMQGRLNTVLTVELDTGTFTVVQDARLTFSGVGLLDPLSASAAADWSGVYAAEADRLNGEWTFTHPAGVAGRVYRLLMIG